MHEVCLPVLGTVAAWRAEARRLAGKGVPAEDVIWRVGESSRDLFADGTASRGSARTVSLPRAAVTEIETALYHSDPERFARAYSLILRLSAGQVRWADRSDAAIARVMAMAKAVRRDIHKMHAFVRFRELPSDGPRRRFGAWFEPEHPIVEAATPFFAKRFGDMDWVIATPLLTARFVDGHLTFERTSGQGRPLSDATEELWRTYYASIFNPARLMVKAMQAEMPKKYWRNLPEASLIPDLIRGAEARTLEMAAAAPTEPPARRAAALRAMAEREGQIAETGGLDGLKAAAADCTRCPLHGPATQTVFGEGPEDARLMIVGEQPGDREDLEGRPFVGPAGQLFDKAAAVAGLDRSAAYVTNAVKHFKFTVRGKRRIHQKATAGEVQKCRWWLDQERALIRPQVIVAMGATACAALTGTGAGILKRRGTVERAEDDTPIFITVHPSYILRLRDDQERQREFDAFCADLSKAVELLA